MKPLFDLLQRYPRFPLALLIGMLGLGLIIEVVSFGSPRLATKLPVLLLIAYGWRPIRN